MHQEAFKKHLDYYTFYLPTIPDKPLYCISMFSTLVYRRADFPSVLKQWLIIRFHKLDEYMIHKPSKKEVTLTKGRRKKRKRKQKLSKG